MRGCVCIYIFSLIYAISGYCVTIWFNEYAPINEWTNDRMTYLIGEKYSTNQTHTGRKKNEWIVIL